VDNIAHNLANANTVGFKARQIQFQDSVVPDGGPAGRGSGLADECARLGLQIGLGTRPHRTQSFCRKGFQQHVEPRWTFAIPG